MSRAASFYLRIFPWIVFVHSLLFMVFWLTNSLFYASTNDYLANMLGKRMDYVSLLIWVSVFVAAWSGLRGVLGLLGRTHRLYRITSWIFGIIALVYIIFFYASFALLFRESPVQLVRIGQLISYFRLIPDIILLLGLAVLVAFYLRSLQRTRQAQPFHWPVWLGVLVGYLILWGLPVLFPPGAVLRATLPTKPMLIAHRGASMLAPENTIAAANLALSIGVMGLETDVKVSRDGQLFLLHDGTFARTTDIDTVFPGRKDEPAGNFTIDQVRQLNAGKWFVDQDPYGTIRSGQVAPPQVQEYEQQGVPLLSDWLKIVKQHNLIFIFDLGQPPESNPYAASVSQLTLDELHKLVNPSLVWFLVDMPQAKALHRQIPDLVLAYGLDYRSPQDAANLGALGYLVVNSEYGLSPSWIHKYQKEQLWVNLYTVDEPWQFSRLWLLGVDSVTTSNVKVMADLQKPVFSLGWGTYLVLWGIVGIIGLGVLVAALRNQKKL